jgi:hypothetical protein
VPKRLLADERVARKRRPSLALTPGGVRLLERLALSSLEDPLEFSAQEEAGIERAIAELLQSAIRPPCDGARGPYAEARVFIRRHLDAIFLTHASTTNQSPRSPFPGHSMTRPIFHAAFPGPMDCRPANIERHTQMNFLPDPPKGKILTSKLKRRSDNGSQAGVGLSAQSSFCARVRRSRSCQSRRAKLPNIGDVALHLGANLRRISTLE